MIDIPPNSPSSNPSSSPIGDANRIPPAEQRRRRFAAIWLIPVIALVVTAYLGIRSYATHGPLITIVLKTADGISSGQTQVKYKAVTVGTVEDIALLPDRSAIVVKVRMAAAADSMLTDHARFWVVRPRLNAANISSLSTLVSGTYIQLEPGAPGGIDQRQYLGLDNPPDVAPDEPGTQYTLKADNLGSINAGSSVYYRDLEVGQVISVEGNDAFAPMHINIFVRAPFDKFVRADSRFWGASALTIKNGAGGFQVQLQSFQAFMIGGVAFETPGFAENEPQAPARSEYVFYHSHQIAEASVGTQKLSFITYLHSSINDLASGSPVEIYGMPVGHVTDVRLSVDPAKNDVRVRVAFDIQPEETLSNGMNASLVDYPAIIRQMVQNGMRAKIESSGLVIGQQIVSLEFIPQGSGQSVPQLTTENGVTVLPGDAGGIGGLTEAMGDIAVKLNRIPFDEIGANLNHLLAGANKTVNGPDLQQAIHALAQTMANARDLSRTAKESATPALQRLPDISAQLQQAVQHANDFLGGVNNSYGAQSDFNRNARRVLDQANEAARSIRLLADYLERHPEALLQGKTLSTGKAPVDNADVPPATPAPAASPEE